jgi:hypothetical protein
MTDDGPKPDGAEPPQSAAALMGLGLEAQRPWRQEELAAVLQHQLDAPLQVNLAGLGPTRAAQVRVLSEAEGLLLKKWRDLLQHPHPPLDLLCLVKGFAKAHREHPQSPLPREVATVLYYASIVAARLRCGERITELPDADLRKGLHWAIDQAWLDPWLKELFASALNSLP